MGLAKVKARASNLHGCWAASFSDWINPQIFGASQSPFQSDKPRSTGQQNVRGGNQKQEINKEFHITGWEQHKKKIKSGKDLKASTIRPKQNTAMQHFSICLEKRTYCSNPVNYRSTRNNYYAERNKLTLLQKQKPRKVSKIIKVSTSVIMVKNHFVTIFICNNFLLANKIYIFDIYRLSLLLLLWMRVRLPYMNSWKEQLVFGCNVTLL